MSWEIIMIKKKKKTLNAAVLSNTYSVKSVYKDEGQARPFTALS